MLDITLPTCHIYEEPTPKTRLPPVISALVTCNDVCRLNHNAHASPNDHASPNHYD